MSVCEVKHTEKELAAIAEMEREREFRRKRVEWRTKAHVCTVYEALDILYAELQAIRTLLENRQ